MKINKMSGRIHPLVAAASVSVMLVSLIGVAAITGLLPNSTANQPAATTTSQTGLLAASQPQTPVVTAQAPVTAAVKHTAPHPRPATYETPRQVAAICNNCGRVESVQAIQVAARPSGVGVGVGAVLGGLLGSQVGGGNGRTLATVAGAVGGGYAGNEVEKRSQSSTTYQVRVRMDDGELRTFPQNGPDGWRSGDRVRVVNGALTSRG